ncbi:beta-lactamase class A [Ligilactobacillus salitolerans]|uniref:Beta-lactamase class A n=1 Tax=Ligilactobacillus salitolerans TaxID=1808352 RepID=A0A401IVC1_9LACO|nr:serine hydrolase [Ligilactobacillus salitolerans]GBG95493.1 beta-lactamase class A [Ligilactobacillus salitolerans]
MRGLNTKLAVELTKLLQKQDFQAALMMQDQTGKTFTFHEQQVFPSASLIKLGIAAFIKEEWRTKPDLLGKKLVVNKDQRVAGAGVMHFLHQSEWSLGDVLALMLSTSDNTAANLLIDTFGLEQIDSWLAEKDTNIKLQRHFISPVIDGRDNFLTAEALLPIWQSLLDGNDEFSRIVAVALHEQIDRNKLVYYADDLQFDGETYNKTGDLANVEHDCARLQRGDAWFDSIVLTKFENSDQHQAAVHLQHDIGKLLLENLKD